MSTLAIKNKKTPQLRKTIIVYVVLTAAAVVFDQIYALFGHGVRSSAMSLMFLYPLLGGAFFYLLAGMLIPGFSQHGNHRLGCNIYNSGIAILTVGSLLKGILDIAGTASVYVPLYFIAGGACTTAGLFLFGLGCRQFAQKKCS